MGNVCHAFGILIFQNIRFQTTIIDFNFFLVKFFHCKYSIDKTLKKLIEIFPQVL